MARKNGDGHPDGGEAHDSERIGEFPVLRTNSVHQSCSNLPEIETRIASNRLDLAIAPPGILRLADGPRLPAAKRLARHITTRFDDLRQLIKRRDNSIVWRTSDERTAAS